MNDTRQQSADGPYGVLYVGEPAVVREPVERALAGRDDVRIDAALPTVQEALQAFRKRHADVVIVDIGSEEEHIDAAVLRFLRIDSKAKIVLVSTLTFANVKSGMLGLQRGAAEFVQTPTEFTPQHRFEDFRDKLVDVVLALGEARRRAGEREKVLAEAPLAADLGKKTPSLAPAEPLSLRRPSQARPRVMAIGVSTGGPQALNAFIEAFPETFDLPILITQHMEKSFTKLLADSLMRVSGRQAAEAENAETLVPGRIYLAPGDRHMTVAETVGQIHIRLNRDPPVNFCRPAVDPLFTSVARVYGPAALAVVLTGMGRDGAAGAADIVAGGGTVIAQDFDSSVVWGMPGAVATAGLCARVLPLGEIAGYILDFIGERT